MGLPTIPQGVKPLRVSELNAAADEVLREALDYVWVEGEINRWTKATSGHIYFGLTEGKTARIDAAMWQSYTVRLPAGVVFRDGMAVVAYGKLNVYKVSGKFQILVERLFPVGIGSAEEALRRLKEKLHAKGYFLQARKRPLPTFPRRIALVTSPTGAAIRDMLEVFSRRWPLSDIVIVGVRVQGDGAAKEIVNALNRLNDLHDSGELPLDAIIVGRGGGSVDDLGAFNEEAVADAIYQSHVPVVSAVGHEIDMTIADLVADFRALTPTHAATSCVPDRAETLELVEDRGCRLRMALQRLATRGRERLIALANRRAFRVPLERVHALAQSIDERQERLAVAANRRLETARQSLLAKSGRLEALSPLNVLNRGYSLTQTDDGHLVRDASALRIGDTINTRVARGRVRSVVTGLEESSNG